MIPLANKEYESYLNRIKCHIGKKSLDTNTLTINRGIVGGTKKGLRLSFKH